MSIPMMIIIAVVAGLLVGLIGTGVLKGELRSVAAKTQANSYVTPGSLNVTGKNEIFLYSKEEKREKPRQNTEKQQ